MDYIYNPNTNELYHYGVKGMKWGVRKKQYGESFVSTQRNPKLEKYERDRGINSGLNRRNQSDDLRDAGAIGTMAGKAINKAVRKGVENARNSERRVSKAESKAHKKLEKASNSYFRARDFEKVGNKKASEAASKNAEKNINSAKKILDKVGSTRSDNLFGMTTTQNGYEYWKKYGYETR